MISISLILCTDYSSNGHHFYQGEYLQIPHDGCCPECVGTLAPCLYDSKTIPVSTNRAVKQLEFSSCFYPHYIGVQIFF